MGLIQKASGVNSATFSSPTQLNSNIVVFASVHDGSGFIDCTDNLSQSYLFASINSQIGNVGTFWFARSYSLAGVTTVTVTIAPGPSCNVWAYELQQPVDGSGPFGPFPGSDLQDGTDNNNGNSATPVGSGIFNGDDFGTDHIYFTLCAVNAGTVVSTDSPWTLDTIRDGDAVAYLDESTGDLTAGFTLDAAHNFAMQEVSFYTATPPPPCPIEIANRANYPNTGNLSTGTFSIPSTTPGNILIIGGAVSGQDCTEPMFTSLTDNAGDTFLRATAAFVSLGAGVAADIWYAICTGAANSISFTANVDSSAVPTKPRIWVYEISGSDLAFDTADLSGLGGFGAGTFASPSLPGTGLSEFYLAVAATDQTVTSVSGGWTLDDVLSSGGGAGYLISSGTNHTTFAQSPNGVFAIAAVCFSSTGTCAECCPPAIPPDGPFDDFTELDPFAFFPGEPLRASTLEVLNKNILEATLSPEIFAPVVYHNGDIVPLPVSPVDGYAYSREELTYLWNWNNTGPESEIRLPIFSGFIFNSAGAFSSLPGFVHTQVFRLPAGHPPVATTDGSLRCIVIGSRQAQHPAILDDGANDPGGGPSPDDISGSLSVPPQGAAFPSTVLFTVPDGGSGTYQVSYIAKVTQVAGTSSSLGGANGFQVTYTDASDLQELTTPPTPVNAGNALSTQISGVIPINAAENTTVEAQLDYSSLGSPGMQFSLEITWKRL